MPLRSNLFRLDAVVDGAVKEKSVAVNLGGNLTQILVAELFGCCYTGKMLEINLIRSLEDPKEMGIK